MHLTITGLVFVPIIIGTFVLRPSKLEQLLIVMAVFQGAAVLNAGGGFAVGLSPFFFTACLLSARTGARWVSGKIIFRQSEASQIHLRIVSLFVGWCVISSFFLPRLFDGIPVDSPRAGAEAVFYLALPLHWSFSNMGQAGYMVLIFMVLLAFADCAERRFDDLLDAFTYSGLIVTLVGFYQMLSFSSGLPFPSTFFNSNGAWAQNFNQMIGDGWHRVSSTYVEPSDAGGFLASWVLFELILANWGVRRRKFHGACLLAGSTILLATTSTTGYVTIGLVMGAMAVRFTYELMTRRRILIRIGLAITVLILAGTAFVATHHGMGLLDSVVLNKGSSSSGIHRMATVWRAFAVVEETYGLGAGLGSNRAFGTFAYVISNVGIFGFTLFFIMSGHLLTAAWQSLQSSTGSRSGRLALSACIAAFVTNLLSLAISGAEITNPRLWIAWGLAIAAIRAHAYGTEQTYLYTHDAETFRACSISPAV